MTDDSDVALIDVERDTAWVTLLDILPRTVSGLTETDELTWTPGYEESAIKDRIRQISGQEKLALSNEIVDAIAEVAEGDMRKAINVLQTMASSGDITEKRVYEMFGYSSSEEFASLVSAALEHGLFDEAREKLDELMIKMGVSGIDILRGMHSVVRRHRMPGKEKLEVIIALAEAEYRIVEGGSDNIQLDALLARLVKIGSEFS